MDVLPRESLKFKAIREAVLWEDDNHVYRRLLHYIRARRITHTIKSKSKRKRVVKILR